jgi:hypothetical protein
VLPHQVAAAQGALVRVEHLDGRGVLLVPLHHLVRLVVGEVRDVEVRDLLDQRLHLLLEGLVELVPVLVVVARAPLEEGGTLGDLVRVGHRVPGDVDVAVDDPVVDSHRDRQRKEAVLPLAERLVGRVDAGHVERRHRHREVHRVPEPEPALVGLAPALGEQGVVRVHLLPALAARRCLDLVRARECARLGRRGHTPVYTQPMRAVRQPALHGRLGRRRCRRGGRTGRHLARAGRPRLRDAALSARGRLLRRVRGLAVEAADTDPGRALGRRGGGDPARGADRVAVARRDGRRRRRLTGAGARRGRRSGPPRGPGRQVSWGVGRRHVERREARLPRRARRRRTA